MWRMRRERINQRERKGDQERGETGCESRGERREEEKMGEERKRL